MASGKNSSSYSVPLANAVLCVNCECVTISRRGVCPVCGSDSLLQIGPLLGGAPLPDIPGPIRDRDAVHFDLTITLELRQMNTLGVNAVIERISRLIGPRLDQRRACFHVKVEPVSGGRDGEEKQAACAANAKIQYHRPNALLAAPVRSPGARASC